MCWMPVSGLSVQDRFNILSLSNRMSYTPEKVFLLIFRFSTSSIFSSFQDGFISAEGQRGNTQHRTHTMFILGQVKVKTTKACR